MYVFLPYMVYFVELNGEILEALNKASIIITDKIFLEGKELIPISILDNMCKINLKNKFDLFSEQWSPKIIAQMNDYHFKLVKIEGEFTWHDGSVE